MTSLKCPPYNDKRLGCIGCPMAGEKKRLADFERYPKYKAAYIMAFEKMIANHPGEIRVLNKRIPMDEMGGGGYSTGGFGSTETKSQRKISHSLSEANFIFRLWSENSYRRKSLRGTDDALVARTDQRKARRIP